MTNIVIETGRLTADPELRYTGETPLCKFRIAVDRPKKKGADKPETDFFNCTAWNHNAEFINDMFSNIDTAAIVRIITGTADVKPKPKSVKISEETFYKYFEPGTKKAQVTETVEKALAFYFANVESET